MIALEDRCSFTAARRADDLSGTAPPAQRFLLVEQPGPWGRLAMEESGLDHAVGLALARACGAQATRPLLIRRPGRSAVTDRKRWFLATASVGHTDLQTGTVGSDRELLDILDAADIGVSLGERVETPLFAVCTHGRHDACCAIKGRPVAAALSEELGDGAWEVSHLGGDRFAGNVLVLPWGLYYGRVETGNAAQMVAATQAGEVVPALYRGRSAFAPAAQAAQAFARAKSGLLGIDDHTPSLVRKLDGQRFEVTVAGPAGVPWLVTVERGPGGPPALLTCAARAEVSPPTYALIDLAT